MAVRQEVNDSESSVVVHELEFAMNLALRKKRPFLPALTLRVYLFYKNRTRRVLYSEIKKLHVKRN